MGELLLKHISVMSRLFSSRGRRTDWAVQAYVTLFVIIFHIIMFDVLVIFE